MAREPTQFTTVIDYILELMGGGEKLGSNEGEIGSSENLNKEKIKQHFEVVDTGAGNSVKIVNGESCALTAALNELIKVFKLSSGSFLERRARRSHAHPRPNHPSRPIPNVSRYDRHPVSILSKRPLSERPS